ncbi:sigma-w pathway protein ysdB [Neobacillus pocheonensis]|jgi:hypothetical protein|uniref:Sigma-w pathway protein ysdB n=1 Tax=Neobacillus pocheonensis TaxID=363869 RepID=A0ABT0W531_9BACI|nr:sigma-w pathway protein ysdB [Neobacillus pocheonensis]
MVWLLRFVLLFLIIFFLSFVFKLLFTSKRKLDAARRQKRFLLLDHKDVRRNFILTYKGDVFAGEKYLGNSDNILDVVSICIWSQSTSTLNGLVKEDLYFIERKIHEQYPIAEITWKSPVKEFLHKK